MKFFLDSANLKDISWATQAGLIDGITTNPSLLAKVASDLDPRDVLKEICSLVEGPVSAEVVSVEADAMVREGHELAKITATMPCSIIGIFTTMLSAIFASSCPSRTIASDRKSTRLNSSHQIISYAVF